MKSNKNVKNNNGPCVNGGRLTVVSCLVQLPNWVFFYIGAKSAPKSWTLLVNGHGDFKKEMKQTNCLWEWVSTTFLNFLSDT